MYSYFSPVTVCYFLQFRSRGRLLLSSVTELDVCAHGRYTASLFYVTTAVGQFSPPLCRAFARSDEMGRV